MIFKTSTILAENSRTERLGHVCVFEIEKTERLELESLVRPPREYKQQVMSFSSSSIFLTNLDSTGSQLF